MKTEADKKNKNKLKIVIFASGSGTNLEAILTEWKTGILKNKIEVAAVISDNPDAYALKRAENFGVRRTVVDRKRFRSVPGKERRRAHEKEIERHLDRLQPDLVVLAGYMRILTPEFVRKYWKRIVNIHPADTAAYQGPDGYGWAAERKKEITHTKITVHFVDEGVDTGPVIRQEEVPVYPDDTVDSLKMRGLKVEHELYPEVLRDIADGRISTGR